MTTHYLRFPDEESCKEAFLSIGAYVIPLGETEGNYITATHDFTLDVIGTIYRPGEYDPQTGEELSPPVALNGWHVNYLGNVPENCQEYIVFPGNPVRKFAGVD